jgi:hypothetical protein
MENGNLGSVNSKQVPSDYDFNSFSKPYQIQTEMDYHIKVPQNQRNNPNV